MSWIELILFAVIGLGGLWIKYLDHRLKKKEKESDSLKGTVTNINTQVNVVIENPDVFNQLPEDVKQTLLGVQESTSGNPTVMPPPSPDSGEIDSST